MNIVEACIESRKEQMAICLTVQDHQIFFYPTRDSMAGTLLWVHDHWIPRWEPNYDDLTRSDYGLADLPDSPNKYYDAWNQKWIDLDEVKE